MIDFRIDAENVDSEIREATDLAVELRISTDDLPIDGYVVTVGFQRVWLAVECDGVEIAPGNRLGEPLKSGGVTSKETTELTSEVSKKGSLGGELSASPAGVTAGITASASVSGSNATLKKSILEMETQKNFVVARPNNKWEINSLSGAALSGTYLSQSDKLCSLRPKLASNRRTVGITLSAMKKDLLFEITDDNGVKASFFQGKRNINKERVFKALLGKSMETTFAQENLGKITLSFITNFDDKI